MKIKKMKNSKTTKKKWELKMKKKEPLQCWIVNIMSQDLEDSNTAPGSPGITYISYFLVPQGKD